MYQQAMELGDATGMNVSAEQVGKLQAAAGKLLENKATADNVASPPTSQLPLSQIPIALLAHAACFLEVDGLLRLQRCCRALHLLRNNAAYMMQAWGWAELRLWLKVSRLHEWALPYKHCIDEGGRLSWIRASVWREALPVFRAVLAKTSISEADRRHKHLAELVEGEVPTVWKWATCDHKGAWRVVSDEKAMQSVDVQRVEVLADEDWWKVGVKLVSPFRAVEVRCRLVLQACPYLQHLDLEIDQYGYVEPSHEDTFALVPHLRSLSIARLDSRYDPLLPITEPPVDFERMLHSLPQLISLCCMDIFIDISDLFDIASHSTLERLHINSRGQQLAGSEWIGTSIILMFPSSAQDMQPLDEQHAAGMLSSSDTKDGEERRVQEVEEAKGEKVVDAAHTTKHAAGSDEEEMEEKQPQWMRDDVERMQTALIRTQPTRRSCEVRLSLADWLHRRFRRDALHTDEQFRSLQVRRHFRSLLALLHETLLRQLSELSPETAAAVEAAAHIFYGHALRIKLDCFTERLRLYKRELRQDKAQLQLTCKSLHGMQLDRADALSTLDFSMAVMRKAHLTRQIEVLSQKIKMLRLRVSWLRWKMGSPRDEVDARFAYIPVEPPPHSNLVSQLPAASSPSPPAPPLSPVLCAKYLPDEAMDDVRHSEWPLSGLGFTLPDQHAASTVLSSPSTLSSFPLHSLLPSPLLAIVLSHLQPVTLLRLQRCSSTLHRLRSQASFAAVAWRHAVLHVRSYSLAHRRLSLQQKVERPQRSSRISVHEWWTALPELSAVLAEREQQQTEEPRQQLQQLRQWVEQPQPTEWILARRDQHGALCEVDDEKAQPVAEVERVEVLRNIDWTDVHRNMLGHSDGDVHCRLVLRACPHLQHLHLEIDSSRHVILSHDDTFALVPRLRSLSLVQAARTAPELLLDEPPVDFERMLDSLPWLTSLACEDIYMSVGDLLDIASHSTLEQLSIEADGQQLGDAAWIGREIRFPVRVEEDEAQLQQAGDAVLGDDADEEQQNEEDEVEAPQWTRDDTRRMQAALTRTWPTRRSCEVRLALADWLHRRLRRGGLPTNQRDQPAWLLRYYRKQVALLRSSLRHQLTERAEPDVEVDDLQGHAAASESASLEAEDQMREATVISQYIEPSVLQPPRPPLPPLPPGRFDDDGLRRDVLSEPFHPHPDELAIHQPAWSDSSSPTYFQLNLLSPALLALVASHLPYQCLLCLQRCSTSLHRLRANDSYMAAAWCDKSLSLHTSLPLLAWALPQDQCVHGSDQFIPLTVWQAALPAFKAVVAKRERHEQSEPAVDEQWREQLQQLRQWIEQPQPTATLWARREEFGDLIEDHGLRRSGVDYSQPPVDVEVLRDLSLSELYSVVPEQRDVEVRCRLVLQACPYLQHLELVIDPLVHVEPSHEDTFALVPRLRSLSVSVRDHSDDEPELLIDQPPVDFERMLDSLPCLVTLHCVDVYISISDLLDIASHSTLEQLSITAAGRQLADAEWIGDELTFPIGVEEDEWHLAQAAKGVVLDGDAEAEQDEEWSSVHTDHTEPSQLTDSHSVGEEGAPAWTLDDVKRMQAALCRTRPTRRSCETRMALADWLHRRLRRGRPHTNSHQPAWLLHHYRQRVALLRSTLHHQLSELSALGAVAAEDAGAGERLQQTVEQLRERLAACRDAMEHVDMMSHERQRLVERDYRMNSTERRITAVRLAALESNIEAQRQKATELNVRVQWLMERVLGLQQQQAVGARQEQKHALAVLVAQVADETRQHQQWMEQKRQHQQWMEEEEELRPSKQQRTDRH